MEKKMETTQMGYMGVTWGCFRAFLKLMEATIGFSVRGYLGILPNNGESNGKEHGTRNGN